jgi:hypothetical protein
MQLTVRFSKETDNQTLKMLDNTFPTKTDDKTIKNDVTHIFVKQTGILHNSTQNRKLMLPSQPEPQP